MKLSRRGLFQGVCGVLLARHAGVPEAVKGAAMRAAELADDATRHVGVRLTHVRERVHQPFRDSLIRKSGYFTGADDGDR